MKNLPSKKELSLIIEEFADKPKGIEVKTESLLEKIDFKTEVFERSGQDIKNILKPCQHVWSNKGSMSVQCFICHWYPAASLRYKCEKCFLEACQKCLEDGFGFKPPTHTTTSTIERLSEKTNQQRLQLLETKMTEIYTRTEQNELRIQAQEEKLQVLEALQGVMLPLADHIATTHASIQQQHDAIKICEKDEEIHTIKVEDILQIGKWQVACRPFIDSGATNTMVSSLLVPKKFIGKAQNPLTSRQFNGAINIYDQILQEGAKLRFKTICGDYSASYNMPPVVWVTDLSGINVNLVIRMTFMFHEHGSITISRDCIQFSKRLTTIPVVGKGTSELRLRSLVGEE